MKETAVWYYQKDGQKRGPESHRALQILLDRGEITANTKVWTETLEGWVSISDLEHFNFTSLDEMPRDPTHKENFLYERETDRNSVRPRSWDRLWRWFRRYLLCFFTFNLVLGVT